MMPKDRIYKSNKLAWMTAAVYKAYVRFLDCKFMAEYCHMLFVIDDYPSHGKIENLKAITLEFLPVNTTTILQHMDQGIIEKMWNLHRKSLFQHILIAYDANKGYNIDLRGSIHLLNYVWKELATTKCFVHAGFSQLHLGEPDDDHQVWNNLYGRAHRIVGEEAKGNFDSFWLSDVPVIVPDIAAEIVDLLLGGPNEDEEPMDEQPRDTSTVEQTQESLWLLWNKV